MRITLPRTTILSSQSLPIFHRSPRRPINSSRHLYLNCKMTTPTFSSNYDAEQGKNGLEPLLKGGDGGGKWSLISSGRGVERSFKFKTFKKTWEFMNTIAAECAVQKHHPEWSNVYNTTFIRWTTHSPPGLSEKDVIMAKFCDEQAKAFGELEVEGGAGGEGKGEGGGVGKELADRVAKEGGDCCVPKKKGGET